MLYLHGVNEVQVLDISTNEPYYGDINTLFTKYATDVDYPRCWLYKEIPGMITAKLNGGKHQLKITDWTGWSDLISISRYEILLPDHKMCWRRVSVNNRWLIAAVESTLPVWDSDNPYHGYHGEVKYKYNCKPIDDVNDYAGRYLDDVFAKYQVDDTEYESNQSYIIETKSGFYNIDRILCCCSDKITGYK